MINVSPVGRNASVQERNDFEKYDKQHQIRAKFIENLKEQFKDLGLTYVGPTPNIQRLIYNVAVTQSAGRFPSMYSPLVGTRHTACNTWRQRSLLVELSIRPSTSSAIKLTRVEMIMKFLRIAGRSAIVWKTRRIL